MHLRFYKGFLCFQPEGKHEQVDLPAIQELLQHEGVEVTHYGCRLSLSILTRSKKIPVEITAQGTALLEFTEGGGLKITPQDDSGKKVTDYLRSETDNKFYLPKVSGWKQLLPRSWVRRVDDDNYVEPVILDLSSLKIPDRASA